MQEGRKGEERPILLVAGGTGGHVFPALAVAQTLKDRGKTVFFLTDARGSKYVPSDLFDRIILTPSVQLQGALVKKLLTLLKMPFVFALSTFHLLRYRPLCVWGFGGYVAFFPLLAARTLRITCGLHQSDALLGRVNRLLAPWMNTVALTFRKTQRVPPHCSTVVTGTPVRQAFLDTRSKGYTLPKEDKKFNLLILGGSQGASMWGKVVPATVALLDPSLQKKLHIVHQCPVSSENEIRTRYQSTEVSFVLAPFFQDLAHQLTQSHLVFSRAGASTLAELITVGRPTLLVPYPYAMDDHQMVNAKTVAQEGQCWMMPEKEITPSTLKAFLLSVLAKPNQLEERAKAMAGMAQIDANEKLATLICDLCPPNEPNHQG